MGRPRGFDEQSVLGAVRDAFWAKGYEATSTRDLTALTGLTPSSMYAAFGDKRTLFRSALAFYLAPMHERMARLEATVSPAQAITGFLDEAIARSLADEQHRGCMLVNSALEATPDNAEICGVVEDELKGIERYFHRCFLAGQEGGEIPAKHAADDAAKHLLTVLVGIRVLARARPDRELLAGAARQALKMLDLPPLASDKASAASPTSSKS